MGIRNVYKIAIVTQDMNFRGGCLSMATSLYKILADVSYYEPHIISLSSSAADRASVRLFAPRTWSQKIQIQQGEHNGIPYQHIGAIFSEFEFQRYQPRVALTQLLNQYDLIQFVTGVPSWGFVAAQVAPPVLLWTATTVWPDRASRVRSAPLGRRLWMQMMTGLAEYYERLALQRAEFVFALSDYTLDSICSKVANVSATVAPYAVNTHMFRPATSSKKSYILSVARFSDKRKNLRLLLHAYSELKRTLDPPPLYVIGDLPVIETQQEMERLGIHHNVHLLGARYGDELADYYRNAMFFVLPSDEEGLGIVVLEAMASGLPVISTRCGGPETLIKEDKTGLLTPVGDVQALTHAMKALIESPHVRCSMGVAGRKRAEERFSTPAIAKIFCDKYSEILDQRQKND